MKAIITDLDRTLLRTDKSVSPYTLKILKKCREHGILIMAASARTMRYIKFYKELIGFDAVTAINGAVVYLPDKTLEFCISPKSGENIIDSLMNYPDTFLSIETNRGLYSNRDIPQWSPVIYDKFPTLPENTLLYKILASSSEKPLYEGIEKALTDDIYYILAKGELIQIMSRSATKWNGVCKMLEYYSISPSEAVYFGDDNDDIDPIINCGLGVAVSNAIPAVINSADKICADNDSDGVAEFIEEHIL